jgi:hypothetical protein
MNKSDKLREYLKAHPGATKAQIVEGAGLDSKFVDAVCRQRVAAGEFILDGDGGFTWNPDYVRGGGVKRSGKKVLGNRAALRKKNQPRKMKTMRELVEKHAPSLTPASHVRSTLAMVEAVLDLDGADPMLVAAMNVHRESVVMLAGLPAA